MCNHLRSIVSSTKLETKEEGSSSLSTALEIKSGSLTEAPEVSFRSFLPAFFAAAAFVASTLGLACGLDAACGMVLFFGIAFPCCDRDDDNKNLLSCRILRE